MRDNLNNKISVLDKMIDLGKEVVDDPFYTVPQNSATNFKQKMGLCELQPLENSAKNLKPTPTCKCLHCENMAKNFLYLESLIRTNYNATNNCNVCHSSLQYLQYINKSILKVFGNYDSVAQAAQAFGHNIKSKTKLGKLRSGRSKRLTTSNHLSPQQLTKSNMKKNSNAKNTSRKSEKRMKGGQSLNKNPIGSLKNCNKKSIFKKDCSNHNVVNVASLSVSSKTKKVKKFKVKVLKNKTKNLLHKIKSRK